MRHLFATAVLALGLTLGTAAVAAGSFPAAPSGEHRYNILRDGARIGTQVSQYQPDGNRLTVLTRMDIEVSLLFVTAYKFVMESREEWVDGQLVSLTTRANDDGKRKEVDLRADGSAQILQISYNGKERSAPAGTLPASLWHPATVDQSILVDVLNGKLRDVHTRSVGEEILTIGGQPVEARHYVMEGDMERELWYAPDGQLLKVLFPGPDGSEITIIKTAL